MKTLGIAVLLLSFTGAALAAAIDVPEIDGTSAVTGLGLLAGAILVLRSRRKS